MKKIKLFFSVFTILSCLSTLYATEITFKCYPGEINTAQDSIVYTYDAARSRFSQDFTFYQVNNPGASKPKKKQFIKTDENKIGWRLWDGQAIHIYSEDNVTAITQIDILCEAVDYVDKRLQTTAGTVSYIGDLTIRITIPHTENVTDLFLFRGETDLDKAEKFRPREITMNYLVTGETYEIPIPLPTLFEPLADTYYRPWNVKLYTGEPNAKIYYTTDGSEPTAQSTEYTAPLYIDSDTEIKSITYKNGVASEVSTGQFNIRELPNDLEANTKYLIDFPQFGKTADNSLPMAQINTPENFDPEQPHPLFVWFNGGNGGNMTNVPKRITENKDFVVVGLPYQDWDHIQGGGWRTPWSYHKTMLDSIGKLLPNIDKDRRIVGGFSSGGAMITQHINFSDLEFQSYFSAFLPSGSAPHSSLPAGVPESIKDKPMLISVGEDDPRSPFVGIYWELVRDNGADAQFNLVEGSGHSIFNQAPEVHAFIKEWIYTKVMVGSNLSNEVITIDEKTLIKFGEGQLEMSGYTDYQGTTITITNILGKVLQIEKLNSVNSTFSLDPGITPNTLYILSIIKNGKMVLNKKILYTY